MAEEILYAVLPCYNEGRNIVNLVKEWERLKGKLGEESIKLQIVIVNDGSDNKTFESVNLLERSYDDVKVVHHQINMGLGAAINTGINYCLSQKVDEYICIMDGDNTHPPEYVFSMINKLKDKKVDCVVASRYRKGAKVEGLSFYRKLLSLGARALYTIRYRIPGEEGLLRDYTCGYRLYRVDMLKNLAKVYDNKLITENGFTCMTELLVKISKANYKIAEVPFNLKYNLKEGQSQMKVLKTINRSLYLMMKL
jgi:dolichol-phosphate mannosyltransferase